MFKTFDLFDIAEGHHSLDQMKGGAVAKPNAFAELDESDTSGVARNFSEYGESAFNGLNAAALCASRCADWCGCNPVGVSCAVRHMVCRANGDPPGVSDAGGCKMISRGSTRQPEGAAHHVPPMRHGGRATSPRPQHSPGWHWLRRLTRLAQIAHDVQIAAQRLLLHEETFSKANPAPMPSKAVCVGAAMNNDRMWTIYSGGW